MGIWTGLSALAIVAAAAALTGCSSKKGADTDGDGKVSAEEVAKEMGEGGAIAMKPGEWEVKINFDKLDSKGLPAEMAAKLKEQLGKGVTVKSCMTKEQAEKPSADFFGMPKEANCTFDQLDRNGNAMNVALTCKPMAMMTVSSKMQGNFEAEKYSMTIDQETSAGPMGKLTAGGKIEGKRLGDCPTAT